MNVHQYRQNTCKCDGTYKVLCIVVLLNVTRQNRLRESLLQKNWFLLLAVPTSSYGCICKVWSTLRKLNSSSPYFPRASITRYTHVIKKTSDLLFVENAGLLLAVCLSRNRC